MRHRSGMSTTRVKKWNPYCIRHSAITDDSDHLPEYALKKKVRWTMNSKQGNRYIKNNMGDELKNKIIEHSGIKVTALAKPQMVARTCGSCGYINKLESKFCENPTNGCHYPQTQLALDEIKAAEDSKLQVLRNEIVETKAAHQNELEMLNGQIFMIQQYFKSYDEKVESYHEKIEQYISKQNSEEERRRQIYEILRKDNPGWMEPYLKTLRGPLTKEDRKRLMAGAAGCSTA